LLHLYRELKSESIYISLCIKAAKGKQASKFIRQKQYYDNINTKCKQYHGRLPEGNPSIELVAYNIIKCKIMQYTAVVRATSV